MNELIESHLNLYVNEFFLSCLALYLSKALTLSEQQQRVGVILAHGYATASSIASSVNEMLGQYVFEAIDMPLDTTTDQQPILTLPSQTMFQLNLRCSLVRA